MFKTKSLTTNYINVVDTSEKGNMMENIMFAQNMALQ